MKNLKSHSNMKSLLILALVVASQPLLGQVVWVANNNFNAPTGSNVFSTIQAAVDAAAPGDIIQVQPSSNTYGNVRIDKQLTLMGIGFNVDKDIPLTSIMGDIRLTNNIDNTSDADGTIIKGLNFTILYSGVNTGPSYVLQNILVQNCQLQYIANFGSGYSPIDGFEVRDCYITSTYYYGINFYSSTTNTIIRNNLILWGIGYGSTSPGSNIITNNILYEGIYVNAEGSNTTILNNNFIASSGGDSGVATELKDCIIANNIFYGMTPSIANAGNSTSGNFQRNVFTNNLVYSTGDDVMPPSGGGASNSGSGNITGTSPLFTNVLLLDTWSAAYDFTLQAGTSPALGAGTDGTDIGISGGSYPITTTNFVLKTTAAPVIQILNTSTVINPGDPLPVRVKANSN
jgi:hypothetical protein